MRSTLAVSMACLVGCGGDSKPPPVDADPGPQWWQPKVGEAKNWDIQLAAMPGMIDVSAPRVMYDLDLWALVPVATTITYDDGTSVAVPAGSLAGTIAQLHARTPPTIVICHVETGILDLTLPDAPKFPGYNADPAMIPDTPTAPAAGSVIGWHVGSSMKRWLDIREASREKVVPIMFKRFDLARQIGCDGVDPDRNLAAEFAAATGFSPDGFDSYSWFAEIAKQGHARKLSTGMKNGHALPSQTDMEADKFDWLMIERCGEPEILNCGSSRPFIERMKAVFAIDYDQDSASDPQDSTGVCAQQQLAMIADGIYKDVGLTGKAPVPCSP